MLSRRSIMKTAAMGSMAAGGHAFAQTDVSKTPVTIRYAILGVRETALANLYQYLALKNGVYLKHGIDLRFVIFLRGGTEVMAGAASGQVDLGELGTPILSAISTDVPIKIVGAPPFKKQAFVLVVQPGIQSLSDLKGQVVSISDIGGGADQALDFILRAHGLPPNYVQKIAVSGNGNYAALKSKRIAGAVMSEPLVSEAVYYGVGKVLAKAVDYYGHYEHSYVFASTEVIAQHPEAISAFFRANREAIDYAKAHEEEIVAYGTSTTGLDRGIVAQYFKTYIPQWDDSQQVDIQGMLTAIKYLKELNYINPAYKPDVSQIADLRFNGQQT